ncbi:MAG TPA: SpoIIE family protein phosphatase [Terracidiphilus sp.]
MDTSPSIHPASAWRTAPRLSIAIFLLAVFLLFTTLGFANDIIDMGRQPPLKFAVQVLLTGLFAVAFAYSGITLQRRFWKAFIPIFILQFLVMGLIGNWSPPSPLPPSPEARLLHLHSRLIFDGIATIVVVSLGYTGFVYVFISEGRRYVRVQTERAALEREMAAAREVQLVMVPETLPQVRGYAIESVYLPAAQVGGDFFQVIPLESGPTLVVIGDVSGKGLRAAMLVSMIVGTLRTVSGFTEEPAQILGELNRRLCGRMQEGFATCLVARLTDRGQLTLANAGHLPPYLNGIEIELGGSLPLGLVDTLAYDQATLEMAVGDSFVLLTDGIAEAQNEERVLLGFSRVASMLRQGATARGVADIAQGHGQNDDLTVIRVTRELP